MSAYPGTGQIYAVDMDGKLWVGDSFLGPFVEDTTLPEKSVLPDLLMNRFITDSHLKRSDIFTLNHVKEALIQCKTAAYFSIILLF